MSFTVQPAAIRAVGQGFHTLSTTTSYAYYNADVDMDLTDAGGEVFGLIAAEVNSVRDDLTAAYEPGGNVPVLFTGAGDALIETAEDYRSVDAAARAEIDGKLAKVEATESPWTEDEEGIDLAAYQGAYAPVDADYSVGTEALADLFGWDLPDQRGRATDSFESYNDFVGIAEDIDYVIGFSWIGDLLGGIGLPDPIKGFKDKIDGDWRALGRALGAMNLVAQQERAYASDLDGVIKHLSKTWQGNAANSCMAWVAATGSKISGHASDLSSIESRISAEAYAMKSGLDTVCTAVGMLVDLIPNPKDLGGNLLEFGLGLIKTITDKAIQAITKVLELFKLGFDAILTAAFGIVAIFAQLTRFADSAWPATPVLNLPDVNGAKA